jgi:hypothetical protein
LIPALQWNLIKVHEVTKKKEEVATAETKLSVFAKGYGKGRVNEWNTGFLEQ